MTELKTELKIRINEFDKIKEFIQDALSFKSDIDLIKGSYIVDAKSIMGVFSLDLSTPVTIKIHSCDEVDRLNEVMKKYTN